MNRAEGCEVGVTVRWVGAPEREFAHELAQHVSAALNERIDAADLKQGDRAPDSINPGRSRVEFISVRGRALVLRHYCRGGMMRHLLRDSFVRLPFQGILGGERYRPFEELAILEELQAQGVPVPVPVVGGIKQLLGGLLYRAVLVTEELAEVQNLLFLAQTAKLQGEGQTEVAELCKKAGAEAARMVALGIAHPDLHLGNVLVQRGERVILIDFDRASRSELPAAQLAELLIARWNRSLEKHGVAEFTAGAFEAGVKGD